MDSYTIFRPDYDAMPHDVIRITQGCSTEIIVWDKLPGKVARIECQRLNKANKDPFNFLYVVRPTNRAMTGNASYIVKVGE